MSEFFYMGGYAFYVWTSFAFTFLLLGGVVFWSARQLRNHRTSAIRRARQHRRKT